MNLLLSIALLAAPAHARESGTLIWVGPYVGYPNGCGVPSGVIQPSDPTLYPVPVVEPLLDEGFRPGDAVSFGAPQVAGRRGGNHPANGLRTTTPP